MDQTWTGADAARWTPERVRELAEIYLRAVALGAACDDLALTLARAVRTSEEFCAGSEQSLSVPALRLRGRPDWTNRLSDREVEIVDYKSGRVTDAEGRLLDEHVVQAQLYALMVETVHPSASVTPFIERVERVRVPWGDRERADVRARVQDMSERLPAGTTLKALDLAQPSTHCAACRLRPRCSAYQESAPQWWPDESGSPRPLPMDVWGEVTSVSIDDSFVAVRLTDASGRRVRIDGVSANHGVGSLKAGDALWCFDLESSEDLRQHGRLIQPRSFHEHPPGPRWQRARRLRVFCRS